jgi:hypothetical protein
MLLRVALVRTDVSEETSVLTRATRRNIPEDTILHSHRRENLKSYKYLSNCLCILYLHLTSLFTTFDFSEWRAKIMELLGLFSFNFRLCSQIYDLCCTCAYSFMHLLIRTSQTYVLQLTLCFTVTLNEVLDMDGLSALVYNDCHCCHGTMYWVVMILYFHSISIFFMQPHKKNWRGFISREHCG